MLADLFAYAAATIVSLMAASLLAGIAVVTALTGARTPVRWFKACRLVLASVIALLIAGSVL